MGEYAVVIFVDESTVDVISSSWIEGGGRHEEGEENYCYWPTHNPAYKARKHDIPDEERWGRWKIRVIKLTKDYMKAKNCARKAEETSNLETDDEGTMQRKKRRPAKLDSGSDAGADDSDSEPDTTKQKLRRSPRKQSMQKVSLPKPPQVHVGLPRSRDPTPSPNPVSKSSNLPTTPRHHDPQLASTSTMRSTPTTPGFRRVTTSESSFQVSVLLKLQKLEEAQDEQLTLLRTLINRQPERGEAHEAEEDPLEKPLQTVEEFKDVSERLETQLFRKKMIRHLSLVGGHDLNETIRRVMRKLGTNNLWSSYSVLGRKGKLSIKDSPFYKVIVKACMKNHPQAKEVGIEKGLGDYLKRTPNLPGGRKYKKAGNVDVAVPVGELEDDERGENERVPNRKRKNKTRGHIETEDHRHCTGKHASFIQHCRTRCSLSIEVYIFHKYKV
ncbi:uncharacterized protein [Amphiura filiformis]